MKKIIFFLATCILYLISPRLLLSSIQAQTLNQDNSGIQTLYQSGVPHLDTSGRTRTTYDPDLSFFPILLWSTDLGPYDSSWNTSRCKFKNPQYCRDTLPELQAAAFNAASFNILSDIARVNEFGFKNFVYVYDVIVRGYREFGPTDDQRWKYMREMVNQTKDNPSTLGYFLFDEYPDHFGMGFTYAEFIQARQEIKKIDPVHPVFPNMYGDAPGGICAAVSLSDILMYDAYSISGADSSIGVGAGSMAGCPGATGKPIITIFQAYKGGTRALPSPAQLRAQAYSAVTTGASGLWYFLQHSPRAWLGSNSTPWDQPAGCAYQMCGGINPQVTPDQWAEASAVNHEMQANKRIIFSPTATDSYNVYRSGTLEEKDKKGNTKTRAFGRIQTLFKNTGENGIRYLLAVGIDATPVTVKFEFPGKTVYRVTSTLDNKTITPSGKSFTDNLPQYGTRLYKVDFNATPPAKPGDLNNDNFVNAADLPLFLSAFSSNNPTADLTADAQINLFDYNVFVGSFQP